MCELHYKTVCERKAEKTLTEHVTRQNYFVIAKFKILKCLKG